MIMDGKIKRGQEGRGGGIKMYKGETTD